MSIHETKGPQRHIKLHRHLDELIACFIAETGPMPSTVTLMEFMEWSHKMTLNPTCNKKEEEADAESSPQSD